MNKTAIEWCDYTWNPVTGCLHNCPYCYARSIARRFGGPYSSTGEIHTLDFHERECFDGGEYGADSYMTYPYPYRFDPTFHRYRLGEPANMKKGQRIFVCSMADLFGDWVPDEWIDDVLNACAKAPQHQYLFLTKNPKRYRLLDEKNLLPLWSFAWYGATINTQSDVDKLKDMRPWGLSFVSIEPIIEPIDLNKSYRHRDIDWIIVGAESGNRKDKVVPQRKWIEELVFYSNYYHVPLFMKGSLAPVWNEPLVQQFPEGLK